MKHIHLYNSISLSIRCYHRWMCQWGWWWAALEWRLGRSPLNGVSLLWLFLLVDFLMDLQQWTRFRMVRENEGAERREEAMIWVGKMIEEKAHQGKQIWSKFHHQIAVVAMNAMGGVRANKINLNTCISQKNNPSEAGNHQWVEGRGRQSERWQEEKSRNVRCHERVSVVLR